MKTLKSFMLLVGILLGSTVFYSCLDDDDAYSEFWRALIPQHYYKIFFLST